MRILICGLFILAAFFNYAAVHDVNAKAALTEVKTQPLNETDKDAYILFTYSLADGENVRAGTKDPTIIVQKEKDGTKFIYKKHALSCGTIMDGWIKKSVNGTETRFTGSFEVSNNSFEINNLNGDYTINSKNNQKKGFIVANDRKIDINLF